ncbi:MAG: 3-oxoacyl-ACP synthase [Crocinitomicaceae bacterium]
MESTGLKKKIIAYLNGLIEEKIQESLDEVASINFSKENETKSSAGDKYETGMAMLQIEEVKAATQLTKARELQQTLYRIDPEQDLDNVQLGSLVETTAGIYFISIPWGKIVIEQQEIFVLSIGSPIGEVLKSKKNGDQFNFRNVTSTILSLS